LKKKNQTLPRKSGMGKVPKIIAWRVGKRSFGWRHKSTKEKKRKD